MLTMSAKAANVRPSATMALNARARELSRAGEEIINLTAGEPDFDTPENIKRAAADAMAKGFTKYTPAEGIRELREAVCMKLLKDNSLEYAPEEIVVSCGAKHSIFNALQSVINDGDEVIIPSPYWVSYAEQVVLAGGIPVFAETPCLDSERIREKISAKTKAIIVNSPNNPTGAVYGVNELKSTAGLARDAGAFIISDEIYEKLVYGKAHRSIAEFAKERTIVVNGVSKAYAMTGWRIGYAAGPAGVMKIASAVQSHTTGSANSIAQKAAMEALTGNQATVEVMRKEFEGRRDFVVKRLQEIGFRCTKPEGAFYAFPEVPRAMASTAFAGFLLDNGVAVVPGIEFGSDRHVRLSYATSMDKLEKAMELVEKAMEGYASRCKSVGWQK
ncbi:MAG: pyridoxal phosphate-dependent aminotransferase [Candidatus Aenigmarchaeota archaeon]|nr:pyridoxal phosphate-dependent aminotransferase [Candidatus Aenigmarchaeota archaeon]